MKLLLVISILKRFFVQEIKKHIQKLTYKKPYIFRPLKSHFGSSFFISVFTGYLLKAKGC